MPAPTPAERQSAYAALATLSRRDLEAVWRRLDLSEPAHLADPLAVVLMEIASTYGSAAASLAADWYDEARDDARAPGAFTATVAPEPDQTRFAALARWGVGPLFGASPDVEAAFTGISGGLQRIVLDQGRSTTADSVALDPAEPRYARHASANACAFCALLASRGAVYRSEASAATVVGRGTDTSTNIGRRPGRGRMAKGIHARGDRRLGEKYHDDCHCVAVEVFDGQGYEEPPYVERWREAYLNAPPGSGPYSALDLREQLASMRKELGTH